VVEPIETTMAADESHASAAEEPTTDEPNTDLANQTIEGMVIRIIYEDMFEPEWPESETDEESTAIDQAFDDETVYVGTEEGLVEVDPETVLEVANSGDTVSVDFDAQGEVEDVTLLAESEIVDAERTTKVIANASTQKPRHTIQLIVVSDTKQAPANWKEFVKRAGNYWVEASGQKMEFNEPPNPLFIDTPNECKDLWAPANCRNVLWGKAYEVAKSQGHRNLSDGFHYVIYAENQRLWSDVAEGVDGQAHPYSPRECSTESEGCYQSPGGSSFGDGITSGGLVLFSLSSDLPDLVTGKSDRVTGMSGILAHELGHNLGLRHANKMICDGGNDAELSSFRMNNLWILVFDMDGDHNCRITSYSDYNDIMGGAAYGRTQYPYLSAPQSANSNLGFIREGDGLTTKGDAVVEKFVIQPVGSLSGRRAVRINNSLSKENYWFEFRADADSDGVTGSASVASDYHLNDGTPTHRTDGYGVRVLKSVKENDPTIQDGLSGTFGSVLVPGKGGKQFVYRDGGIFRSGDDNVTMQVCRIVPQQNASIALAKGPDLVDGVSGIDQFKEGQVSIRATKTVGGTLGASVSATQPFTWKKIPTGFDSVSDCIKYEYQWKRNGVNIAGATLETYQVTEQDANVPLTVSVRARSANAVSEWVTAAVTGTVALSGAAQVGQVLTATPSAYQPNDPTYTYRWYRGVVGDASSWQLISGATGKQYTVTSADINKNVQVRVNATKPGYTYAEAPWVATPAKVSATGLVALSGAAQVGQVLTATPTGFQPADPTYSYQWYRGIVGDLSSWQLINGATKNQYTVTSADAGRNLQVRVTAAKAGYNYAPAPWVATATKVPTSNATAAVMPKRSGTVGDSTTACASPNNGSRAVSIDNLPDGLKVDHEQTCGLWIKGTPTKAGRYNVKVGYQDGSQHIFMWIIHNKENSSEFAVQVPVTSTMNPAVWTATVGVAKVWTSGGINMVFAQNYPPGVKFEQNALNVFQFTGTPTKAGTYTVQVGFDTSGSTFDGKGNIEYKSFTWEVDPPTVGVTGTVAITGTVMVGQTLTATPSGYNPTPTTYSYQWYRGTIGNASSWQAISGATGKQYTVKTDDLGKSLQIRVNATKAGYTFATAPWVATTKLQLVVGTTGTVQVTGTAQMGQRLTATPSGYSPTPTYSYQWYRGTVGSASSWQAISGATGSQYTVAAADVGQNLQVRVNGTKVGYTYAAAPWVATAKVQPIVGVSGTVTITGTAKVGQWLTATPSGYSPVPTYSYQWYRGTVGSPNSWQAISGATAKQYKVTTADVGRNLQVRINGTKAGYTYSAAPWVATALVQPG